MRGIRMSSNYTQEAVVKAVMERMLLNPSEAEVTNLRGAFVFSQVKFVRYSKWFGLSFKWAIRFGKDHHGIYREETFLNKEQSKRVEQVWETMRFEYLNQAKIEQHKRLLRDAGFDNV